MFEQRWRDCPIVSFDLETTGAYPLGSEICEVGAVKWVNGKEVGQFQTLLKPTKTIPANVVAIHGITNEMVAEAPQISEKIHEFHEFLQGSVAVAHHAPFDMGFLTLEFERYNLALPEEAVLCSSLLARQVITESPNHKLQTLIQHLRIPGGTAHRALDDARACMYVVHEVFKRVGAESTLTEIYENQKHQLFWPDYSIEEWRQGQAWRAVIEAIEADCEVEIMYQSKNATTATWRRVHPFGAVRNPDGDWLSAFCLKDNAKKRYYMNKIAQSRPVR